MSERLSHRRQVAGAVVDECNHFLAWGYPFTGVTRFHCFPWAVRWRALQARRVPSGVRRRGRHGSRARAGEEVLVAHRGVGHGEVEHPIEHHPAAAGTAAVEAEHELIQVPGQVRVAHRALVGAQQPPLDQRGDSVHRGEELARVLPASPGGPLAAPVVDVAELSSPR